MKQYLDADTEAWSHSKPKRIGKPATEAQRLALQLGTNIRDARCLASLARRLEQNNLIADFVRKDLDMAARSAESLANGNYALAKRLLMARKLNNMDKYY